MAFSGYLKQSTAVDILLGPFVDDTDGKTAETGLTLDVEVSKNGQALANKNDATVPVHDAAGDVDGYYNCELDATDTATLGILTVVAHAAGALPVQQTYQIVTAHWYDTMCATDYLQVDVIQIESTDATTVLDTQIDSRLDTAIGGSPTAGSVFERIKAIDDKLPTHYLMGSSNVDDHDTTIDIIDTNVEAVLLDTGTTLDGKLDTLTGKVDVIDTTADAVLVDTAEIDTLITEMGKIPKSDAAITWNATALASINAECDTAVADALLSKRITLTGTANAEDSTIKITLTGGVATDNYYNGQIVVITGGTGEGQSRTILKYLADGTVATPTRDWTVAPDGTSTFAVFADDVPAILEAGVATAGGVATITLDATAPTTVDLFKNNFIMITGGTGVGQTRLIGAYSAGRVATVIPNWTVNPDNTSIYQVLPAARVDVGGWAGALVTLSTGNKPDVNVDEWHDVLLATTNPLPNAAPDAAGGLPISDAGGLDLDTQIGTDIDAILTDTAQIGAAGAGLTAVAWNAAWDAEVQSEVNDALVALHLDHLLAADYDPAAKPGVATALLNELVENDGGVSRFTENALEQAPSGTGASAASIADAVWDEALADHDTEDSMGNVVNDLTEESAGTYRFTSAALAAAPTGGAGSGAITFTYTLTSSVDAAPIADASVWVTTDAGGTNVVASGTTDVSGQIVFYLDAATYYIWRQKSGFNFTNPDTEVVA